MTYDNYEERKKKFSPDDLPTSINRKIYTHYNMKGEIEIWDCDLSGKERVLLSEQMIKVKIPEQTDMKAKVVEALENEIEKIPADAHMQVKMLICRLRRFRSA